MGYEENAGYLHYLFFPTMFLNNICMGGGGSLKLEIVRYCRINPLPDMPILGFSNSAANKDMMAKIWMNWDTIICLSRKSCGKRRNCLLRAISPFPTMFSKAVCC